MPRVVSALHFYPRGGSALAARALGRRLDRRGWDVTLVAGSRSDEPGLDAAAFHSGLSVHPVDFAPALASAEPQRTDCGPGTAPMHGSFEQRPGAPDAVFASLDPATYELHVRAWIRELTAAGAAEADVLHLHHLTPLNEAAARCAPEVPVVGQLHGTELLMAERIAAGAPAGWRHADQWACRLRRWADGCTLLTAATRHGAERARDLLDVPRERVVVVPNGFDSELFAPQTIDRAAHWREQLVACPRGWRAGEGAGSVAYGEEEVARMARGTVLSYVGRFTEVKRVPLLVECFARARERFSAPASLVILGGHPGEWEGEHPVATAERVGAEGTFFAGWHNHEQLPRSMAASDTFVLPSVREQFGLAVVEAMGCGLPAIAVDRFGPAAIVENGETGWLVEPDDAGALEDALVEAVNDPVERRRRGERAARAARELWSWDAAAERLDAELRAAAAEGLSQRVA